MTARGVRGGWMAVAAVAALAFALGATPAWGASGDAKPRLSQLDAARSGPARNVTGIVQAVRPHAVVVRQLDGSLVRVPVAPRTVVIVNTVRSSLDAVRPGYIITFAFNAQGRPKLVALDPSGNYGALSKPGTVNSVSADAVVVTDWNKGTMTIAVAPRTRVFLNGSRVAITDIAGGDRLINAGGYTPGQTARVLRFKRPG